MWTEQTPLPFIKTYLTYINKGLEAEGKQYKLSLIQKTWLGFCLMGILMTNTVCWAKFERMSFKSYSKQALSWMFRHAKLPWEKLLIVSTKVILSSCGIKAGILVIDDKDITRSKNAKKIFQLHKMIDKKTGGYCLGQNAVFLYLVTKRVSIPISFEFYAPDPDLKKWRKEIQKLKKLGVAKHTWPPEPERSSNYPKKYELAIKLLENFKTDFPEMKVKAVLADCLYGHLPFIQGVENILGDTQVITKMRKNQKVYYGRKKYSCEELANSYGNWGQSISIRGRKNEKIQTGGGRLYVPSQKAKRLVVAIKYEGEKEYRFLMATNLSWNMKEVIETFTVRWLIEVFFEDWSLHSGFCSLAKQCGEEGSLRPLTLSLLFDHCFFFHADQSCLLENKSSLATFGTLLEKSRAMTLCCFIKQILEEESPKEKLQELVDALEDVFPLRKSKKHFSGIDIVFAPKRCAV